MINLKTILTQSVPRKELSTIEIVKELLVAVGVIYFLFVFLEPFNFDVGSNNKYIIFLWFALAYFLILFILIKWVFPFVNKIINLNAYYFYHFILGYLFLSTALAFTHHVLQNYLNDLPIINFSTFLITLQHALLIGLIPVFILSLISYNRALRKQVKTSVKDLTNSLKKVSQKGIITIASINSNEFYRFEASSIIYIKSDDNYVNIVYQNETSSKFNNELIRKTLKNVEKNLSHPFLRIHRSYIVNLNHVHKISGNSQGMQLSVNMLNDVLPVSRSYISKLKIALKTP